MAKPRNALALRRKAEAHLADGDHEAVLSADETKLMHELRVHQIELQMQNEELARAYDEAASLRDKYLDLYDFAPIGYFTLSPSGVILELNLRAAAMLGSNRAHLTGRKLKDFMQPESLSALESLLAAAAARQGEETAHLMVHSAGGDAIYAKVQAHLTMAEGDGARNTRLVMMDVTEVKFANDELQHAFSKFFTYWRP